MPRGSGLFQKLMEKRRELEKAITQIDGVIGIVHGKIGGRGRSGARRPMSEEQKRKISLAATKRHAQNRKAEARSANARHKAINRPRTSPRPRQQQQEDGMEAEA